MKPFLKPILAFILFLIIQALSSVIVMALLALSNPDFISAMQTGDKVLLSQILSGMISPDVYSAALILSSVLTIVVLIWPMRMFSFGQDFKPSGIVAPVALLAFAGAVCGIFSVNIFSEFADLPNLFEADMNGMFSTSLGVFVIGVLGPLAEEVVFRAGALGYLLRKGVNAWVAIAFSAFLFGVMHFNPAQIPFAMLIGIVLGIIYYRTGNIILTTIIHVFNNSLACFMANVCPEDATLVDMIGGTASAVACGLMLLALSLFLLYKFWGRTAEVVFTE